MTPLFLARAAVTLGARALMIVVLHAPVREPVETEAPRIVGPPPSLIHANDPHVGFRWHSDDPRDQAATIQVTSWALTL